MTTAAHSLSERIADGIVELIHTGGLQPGDALQSSRDLATRFEVTTPTVREALRRLEATDVIRFRHGSGTYVGEGITRRLMANPHVRGTSPDAVRELIEARIVLEPQIAAAAALARTAEHLAALDAAAANALEPQRGDERPALHFHVALAAATGNLLLRETVEALFRVRSREQIEIRFRYDDRERDHAQHLEIRDAIRDRDPEAARRLTHEHLVVIRDTLTATEDQEVRP